MVEVVGLFYYNITFFQSPKSYILLMKILTKLKLCGSWTIQLRKKRLFKITDKLLPQLSLISPTNSSGGDHDAKSFTQLIFPIKEAQ